MKRVHVREYRISRGHYELPADVVYIGRRAVGLRPSEYANPYRIGDQWIVNGRHQPMDRDDVLVRFDFRRMDMLAVDPRWLEPLRGKTLACWCEPSARCHGDLIIDWLVSHPPVAAPGEPIEFGLHVQRAADATTAPAWPPSSAIRRRLDDRIKRAVRD